MLQGCDRKGVQRDDQEYRCLLARSLERAGWTLCRDTVCGLFLSTRGQQQFMGASPVCPEYAVCFLAPPVLRAIPAIPGVYSGGELSVPAKRQSWFLIQT